MSNLSHYITYPCPTGSLIRFPIKTLMRNILQNPVRFDLWFQSLGSWDVYSIVLYWTVLQLYSIQPVRSVNEWLNLRPYKLYHQETNSAVVLFYDRRLRVLWIDYRQTYLAMCSASFFFISLQNILCKTCFSTISASGIFMDGLVHDCSNSIANALRLLQSCTKPSM